MSELANKKCVPCEGGTLPVSEKYAREHLKKVGGPWELAGGQIMAVYTFKDFSESMSFVNKVAHIAEEQGHHPDISISYNHVELLLTTHAIGGLSENDFIVAAKINALAP